MPHSRSRKQTGEPLSDARSALADLAAGTRKLERNLLKHRATELLRDHIIGGRLVPGSKLIERELAEVLGVSRMPVHDALVQLEKEGLVVSRAGARSVIALSERDIRELYQVRLVLERQAVELTARAATERDVEALAASMEAMRRAAQRHDSYAFIEQDVAMHRLIWQQCGNRHLRRTLEGMIGPIFMFVSLNAHHFDWDETLGLHEELVRFIGARDAPSAGTSIERHLDSALRRSVEAFRAPETHPE